MKTATKAYVEMIVRCKAFSGEGVKAHRVRVDDVNVRVQERAEAGGNVGTGAAAADERDVHGVKGREFEFEQDRRIEQVIGWR